jgi:hypothetical protein
VEIRPFSIVIVRSIKMAVVERLVNSHDRRMELISVVKRVHSSSSVDGSGLVSHIPMPSSMNSRRKKRWRGFPGEMCPASNRDTSSSSSLNGGVTCWIPWVVGTVVVDMLAVLVVSALLVGRPP